MTEERHGDADSDEDGTAPSSSPARDVGPGKRRLLPPSVPDEGACVQQVSQHSKAALL